MPKSPEGPAAAGFVPEERLTADSNAEKRYEWMKGVLSETFSRTNIHLDYVETAESKDAVTKYEWMKGLYNFMVERAKTIAESIPTAEEIESGKKRGRGNRPFHDNSSTDPESLLSLAELLKSIEMLGSNNIIDPSKSKDSAFAEATYKTLTDAFAENAGDSLDYYLSQTGYESSEDRDAFTKQLQEDLRRLEGLPDYSPKA